MSKIKIVVAEDDRFVQSLYVKEFSEDRFDTKIVDNGQDAIDAYESLHPDIMLLDWDMPLLNGYKVLNYIRQEKKDKSIPLIMVTSHSEKSEIIDCIKLGLQGYIVKPFKMPELVSKVLKILGK